MLLDQDTAAREKQSTEVKSAQICVICGRKTIHRKKICENLRHQREKINTWEKKNLR